MERATWQELWPLTEGQTANGGLAGKESGEQTPQLHSPPTLRSPARAPHRLDPTPAEVKGATGAAVEVSLEHRAEQRAERVESKEHREDFQCILENERENLFIRKCTDAIVKSYSGSFIRPKNYSVEAYNGFQTINA